MNEFKIWESDREQSTSSNTNPYLCVFDSPRISGTYKISIDHSRNLHYRCQQLSSEEAKRLKERLATALIDRMAEGEQEPLIDLRMIDRIVEFSKPLPAAKRARRLLRFMASPVFRVHESLNFTSHGPLIEAALGVSESTSVQELYYFLSYLVESGLAKDNTAIDGGYVATVRGHESIEQESIAESSSNVFVAMWFTPEMDDVWIAIKKAVECAGYKPVRVDLEKFDGLIDDKIAADIRHSKFVIADLTHGIDGHRGSVYYEAGFARGLSKYVIQTVRKDHLDPKTLDFGIAFDLNHYPVITWSSECLDEFRDDLLNRIRSRFSRS